MIQFPCADLENVKGVLIDIDNTLYEYDFPHQIALDACYVIAKKFCNLSKANFKLAYRKHRTAVTERLSPQGACRSRFLAFQALFEEERIPAAYEKALELDTLYWKTFIQNMVVLDSAKQFLIACQKRKIPVCAVSDMTVAIQVQKLTQLGLTEYIGYLVTSEETGTEKPDSIMYHTALNKLELTASDVIMLGDHIQKDIHAAESLGIRAYHVIINDKEET